jgi:outer membrane protein TolC
LALSEARQKTAAIIYRRTVLRAWHEIDNNLDAWILQQQRHTELVVSYKESEQALEVAEREYSEGAADYITVLMAQRNVLASQSRLNASATDVALSLVNLYKSLGGGWKTEDITIPLCFSDEAAQISSSSEQVRQGMP